MAIFVYSRVINHGMIQQSPFMRDLWLLEVTLITASSSLIRINQNLGRNWKNRRLNSLIPEKTHQKLSRSKESFWHVVYYSMNSYFSLFINKTTCIYISFMAMSRMWCWRNFSDVAAILIRMKLKDAWFPKGLQKEGSKVPPPSKQHEGLSLHHDYL